MSKPLIYLASKSPRRRELLGQLGVKYETISVEIDEAPRCGEAPEVYVLRMALEKARAGLMLADGVLPVLGADTSVVVEGRILGKPKDKADGLAMLASLSGRRHQVLTAVALVEPGLEGRQVTRLSVSHVSFRDLSDAECETYWATGESADKAGAYAVQGYAAAFIDHLDGSFSGVMGLPLFETAELLKEFGVNIYQEW